MFTMASHCHCHYLTFRVERTETSADGVSCTALLADARVPLTATATAAATARAGRLPVAVAIARPDDAATGAGDTAPRNAVAHADAQVVETRAPGSSDHTRDHTRDQTHETAEQAGLEALGVTAPELQVCTCLPWSSRASSMRSLAHGLGSTLPCALV